MLSAHHIHKTYNINPILIDVTFNLNPNERVGLIGPNGCGKTTLIRILAGQETSDQGIVNSVPADLRIGYLPQGMEVDPRQSVADTILKSTGDLPAVEAEVERLALALSEEPDCPDLQSAYDAAVLRLQELSRFDGGRSMAILDALELAGLNDERKVNTLSGGQKTRLSLALVLLGEPQLLLLDEPTNHLDIEMLEWLESWLSDYPGAALIVSHDRTFLDHTVSRVLDLDPETHTIREYTGNYSAYLEQYQAEIERQEQAYRDQVDEIRRMKRDIVRTKQQALHVELTTTSRQPVVRRIAKKVAKKAASREKKLARYLDSDERLEKPRQNWQMKTNFLSVVDGDSKHLSQDALILEDLGVGYPDSATLLTGINLRVRAGQRIAITGPNGTGKTSLLRTVAGQIPPHSGKVRLGANARLGYMAQEQELLDPKVSALEVIREAAPFNETEARSFLHYFLFRGDDSLRPSGELSYGERSRLSLARLVAQGCDLLLLDEPINHLDIPSRTRFEEALAQFNGTILAVVHDRYFIQRFAEEIWRVGEGKVKVGYL
jgi:ATP-binding cassette subfamily F protein 3